MTPSDSGTATRAGGTTVRVSIRRMQFGGSRSAVGWAQVEAHEFALRVAGVEAAVRV